MPVRPAFALPLLIQVNRKKGVEESRHKEEKGGPGGRVNARCHRNGAIIFNTEDNGEPWRATGGSGSQCDGLAFGPCHPASRLNVRFATGRGFGLSSHRELRFLLAARPFSTRCRRERLGLSTDGKNLTNDCKESIWRCAEPSIRSPWSSVALAHPPCWNSFIAHYPTARTAGRSPDCPGHGLILSCIFIEFSPGRARSARPPADASRR